jgi:hypothetical protein
MITAARKAVDRCSWREVYQAALLEANANTLPERIAAAEAAIVMRARELFYTADDDGEEGQSLDDAMCILHALQHSLKRSPTAVPRNHEFNQSRICN